MHFQIILGLSFLCAWTTAYPCDCGLSGGSDVCGDGDPCVPLVIRPAPIQPPPPPQPQVVCQTINAPTPLQPIPGLCACGRTIVTPARNPIPICQNCGGSYSASGASETSSSYDQVAASYASAPVMDPQASVLCSIPADPVSQAIALKKKLQTANIPRNSAAERDISFGFQKLPVEVKEVKEQIVEGELQQINGDILELKLVPTCHKKSLEEEAIEDLMIEEEEVPTGCGSKVVAPSLGDLGFISANAPAPQFVDVEVEDQPGCGQGIEVVEECNDGFQPGQVIVKEGPSRPRSYPTGYNRPPLCLDGERHFFPRGPLYKFSSSASSSSSSSNSQSANSQIFVEEPSCGCM